MFLQEGSKISPDFCLNLKSTASGELYVFFLQVRHLEVETSHWREKYESVKRDKNASEDEIAQLHKQLSKAKFTSDGRVMDPSTEAEVSKHEK